MLKNDLEKKEIRVIPPLNSAEAVFDGKRINQVLINLLTNALKYTPAGGEISVGIKDEPNEVTVTVADTGKGVSEKDIDRVFDEFYRGTGGEEGTGLGLSICRRIITMHGGRIWVESGEGKGSSFHFTLPKN